MKKKINKNDGSVNQSENDKTTKTDLINQTKSVLKWIEKKLTIRGAGQSKENIITK